MLNADLMQKSCFFLIFLNMIIFDLQFDGKVQIIVFDKLDIKVDIVHDLKQETWSNRASKHIIELFIRYIKRKILLSDAWQMFSSKDDHVQPAKEANCNCKCSGWVQSCPVQGKCESNRLGFTLLVTKSLCWILQEEKKYKKNISIFTEKTEMWNQVILYL